MYRSLASLREYAQIDPATRIVEVSTWTETGAWLFTDPSNVGRPTLSTIGCELPFDWVFKGMKVEST